MSSIRTVLSLNAVPEMIRQYSTATLEAYHNGVGPLVKVGLVNGSMLGSFILLYAVLTLCKHEGSFPSFRSPPSLRVN